jgi:hypothetical protein
MNGDEERFAEVCERQDHHMLVDFIRAHTADPETVRIIDAFDAYQDELG